MVENKEHLEIKRLIRNGKSPFTDWLEKLKDVVGRAKIKARILSLERGHFGKHRSLGNGVYELKINFGPGYRIYYGREEKRIVLLLCGGSKSTQKKDIKQAKLFWKEYLQDKEKDNG